MPLITLSTDFATRDGFVGAMKGCLLSLCPQATLVDISHEIPPQDIRAAAWCLARAAPQFPPETIHVVVVDPGVGSARRPLLIRADAHWFIGPDNGLFGEALNHYQRLDYYTLHRHSPWWQAHPSFDGLALFSPAAACLARGEPLEQLASPVARITELPRPQIQLRDGIQVGEILLFDRFGNAITNISGEDLATGPVQITCAEQSFPLLAHYAMAEAQQAIAIINSDGLLELALNQGSAREALGLTVGDRVQVHTEAS